MISMNTSYSFLILATLTACGATVAGGGAYGYFDERHAVGLTETQVPVSGLPAALSGLKLGLITDVHRSRWVPAEDVTAAVQLLMNAKPDLILLGGDYVTWGDRSYVASSADALGGLAVTTFAFLGVNMFLSGLHSYGTL